MEPTQPQPPTAQRKSKLHLKQQLVFYGQYHNNAINKLIHVVFVPTILWTVLVWLQGTPPVIKSSSSNILTYHFYPINASFVLVLGYGIYYFLLEPMAGATMLPLLFTLHHLASRFYSSNENALSLATYIHIGAWIAQFVGHGLAERRAPALLDSLFQSLFVAPFFVWFEILFMFGYRPKLKAQVDQEVMEAIHAWKGTGKAKKDVHAEKMEKRKKRGRKVE